MRGHNKENITFDNNQVNLHFVLSEYSIKQLLIYLLPFILTLIKIKMGHNYFILNPQNVDLKLKLIYHVPFNWGTNTWESVGTIIAEVNNFRDTFRCFKTFSITLENHKTYVREFTFIPSSSGGNFIKWVRLKKK